jgi:fructose-1,6-bisphosphatase I
LILADGESVSEYDLSKNGFSLIKENIKCPEQGNTFSINDGNYKYWSNGTKRWRNKIIAEGNSTSRYVGSLVADAHRTLITGGIFCYPEDLKNKTGKLRLLYECNPMALIFESAGGSQTCGNQSILDINPINIHQKMPLIIGSKENVDKYKSAQKNELLNDIVYLSKAKLI